jgi:uncharacterized protein (DUF1778 family)
MADKSNKALLSVRIEPETRASLETAAELERRTVSNLVNCILADWAAGKLAPISTHGF